MQGEDDLARQTLNLIDEDADRVFALIAVADAKEKLGEKDAATSLLDDARALSSDVPQLASRSLALNEIAARFADSGDAEKARDVALKNLAVIAEIRDESSRAAAIANLSGLFKQSNFELTETEQTILSSLARNAE
jgi:hypothetical protein